MRIEPHHRLGGKVSYQEALDIALGMDYTQTITGSVRSCLFSFIWVWGSGNRCIENISRRKYAISQRSCCSSVSVAVPDASGAGGCPVRHGGSNYRHSD